jgi:hypothetical protein
MLSLRISAYDPNQDSWKADRKAKGRTLGPPLFPKNVVLGSGRLPSPSPPREKAAARGDEAGQTSADDGAGNV